MDAHHAAQLQALSAHGTTHSPAALLGAAQAHAAAVAQLGAAHARLAALDAALVRLRGAWLALCTCVDEFEPADMTACGERRDALDAAILAVLAAHEESL